LQRGSWLYDALGHIYFFLDQYEKAIDVSHRALQHDPSLFGPVTSQLLKMATRHQEPSAAHPKAADRQPAGKGQERSWPVCANTRVSTAAKQSLQTCVPGPAFAPPCPLQPAAESL
jgi:hypothetical protein